MVDLNLVLINFSLEKDHSFDTEVDGMVHK
jgi:hypothetical protein